MNCPNDGSVLVMSDRSGIEIDYCPQCRGVWLDRGELDKIIDRSLTQPQPQGYVAPVAPQQAAPPPPQQQYQQPRYDDRGYQQGYNQPYRKKKESWLSELFD